MFDGRQRLCCNGADFSRLVPQQAKQSLDSVRIIQIRQTFDRGTPDVFIRVVNMLEQRPRTFSVPEVTAYADGGFPNMRVRVGDQTNDIALGARVAQRVDGSDSGLSYGSIRVAEQIQQGVVSA